MMQQLNSNRRGIPSFSNPAMALMAAGKSTTKAMDSFGDSLNTLGQSIRGDKLSQLLGSGKLDDLSAAQANAKMQKLGQGNVSKQMSKTMQNLVGRKKDKEAATQKQKDALSFLSKQNEMEVEAADTLENNVLNRLAIKQNFETSLNKTNQRYNLENLEVVNKYAKQNATTEYERDRKNTILKGFMEQEKDSINHEYNIDQLMTQGFINQNQSAENHLDSLEKLMTKGFMKKNAATTKHDRAMELMKEKVKLGANNSVQYSSIGDYVYNNRTGELTRLPGTEDKPIKATRPTGVAKDLWVNYSGDDKILMSELEETGRFNILPRKDKKGKVTGHQMYYDKIPVKDLSEAMQMHTYIMNGDSNATVKLKLDMMKPIGNKESKQNSKNDAFKYLMF